MNIITWKAYLRNSYYKYELDLSSLSNSVVAYNRDFFGNMASENSWEVLDVRNAFNYIGRLEGSNPKAIL